MKLPLKTDLWSDTSEIWCIVPFSKHADHISATIGQLLPTQCNISDRHNHRSRITRTDSSGFLFNYGLCVDVLQFCTNFSQKKPKITQSSNWNHRVSSVYSKSTGRIPADCVYAARADATFENTEVMSLVFAQGKMFFFSKSSKRSLHSTMKTYSRWLELQQLVN